MTSWLSAWATENGKAANRHKSAIGKRILQPHTSMARTLAERRTDAKMDSSANSLCGRQPAVAVRCANRPQSFAWRQAQNVRRVIFTRAAGPLPTAEFPPKTVFATLAAHITNQNDIEPACTHHRPAGRRGIRWAGRCRWRRTSLPRLRPPRRRNDRRCIACARDDGRRSGGRCDPGRRRPR